LRGLLLENKGGCRVVVTVELLQRSVSTEMDRAWIRKLDGKLSMTAGGSQ